MVACSIPWGRVIFFARVRLSLLTRCRSIFGLVEEEVGAYVGDLLDK